MNALQQAKINLKEAWFKFEAQVLITWCKSHSGEQIKVTREELAGLVIMKRDGESIEPVRIFKTTGVF